MGFSLYSLASSLGMMAFSYIISQLVSYYTWRNKNEDGTPKAPWAPAPTFSSWLYNGWEEFDSKGYRVFSQWAAECGKLYTVTIGQKQIIVLNDRKLAKHALLEKEQANSAKVVQSAVEAIMTSSGKTVFSAPFDFNWQRVRRAVVGAMTEGSTEWFQAFYDEQADKFVQAVWQAADKQGTVHAAQLRSMVDMVALETSLLLIAEQEKVDPDAMVKVLDWMEDLEQEVAKPRHRARLFHMPGVGFVDMVSKILWGDKAIRVRNAMLDLYVQWIGDMLIDEPVADDTEGSNDQVVEDKTESDKQKKAKQKKQEKKKQLQPGRPHFTEQLRHIKPSKYDASPVQFPPDQIAMNLLHLTLHSYKLLSTALFTLVQRVATLPDWQDRVRDQPDLARAFVRESLRVNPPLPAYAHAARIEGQLDWQGAAYRVDNGMELVVNVDAIHADDETYAHATQFDPERFLDPATPELLTFGLGRRHCQGSKFSEDLLTRSLLALVTAYTLNGGNVDQRPRNHGIWSWLGRAETIGTDVTLKRRR
ncbi:cytochrome P450 [Gongronella butleri]|nr:cytochrome P450 [Gongronella butleri]